jgi:lysophospholipase L1-like esterase
VFLKRLESLLGPAGHTRIETINSGVPGWGLNQYYLYLRQFGVRYNPDIVVLAYFTDDLNNAILESIPPNEQYRGGLRYRGGTLHHSRLYNFLKSFSDRIREKNRVTRVDYLHNLDVRRAEWAKRENYLMTKHPNEEQYERLLDDYLARIKRIVSDAGGILVVMYIPDIAQLHHPEAQNINRLLSLHTQQQGIPFVDMTPVFEQASGYETYYLYPQDAHTNDAGHLAMAKALANLICKAATKDLLACQGVLQ